MNRILSRFLERQASEGAKLAAESDVLDLKPICHAKGPAQHFIARFNCLGFVKEANGEIRSHNRFEVGIYFDDEYLRRANTFHVLTWLKPDTVFHPNIRSPHLCVGDQFFRPGTPLVEVLYQTHALITYRKWASNAGLNPEACQWAINNQHLFPTDPRPLKRRQRPIEVEHATVARG
jgi:hypothetical protein